MGKPRDAQRLRCFLRDRPPLIGDDGGGKGPGIAGNGGTDTVGDRSAEFEYTPFEAFAPGRGGGWRQGAGLRRAIEKANGADAVIIGAESEVVQPGKRRTG